ncbi:MAG: C40 family peptidase [Crocinitomicaceae bacterium]|nr:MAG: hypothetical protein CBB76_05505 [Crocinitomicaceae bacterium TMED16]
MAYSTQIKIKLFFLFFFLIGASGFYAQNKKLDRLEQFYSQGHYKTVYRKANKLLRDPMYDGYVLPAYYSAMSTFQLLHNPYWMKRNTAKVDEGCRIMSTIFSSDKWAVIKETHAQELGDMAVLFERWLKDKNTVVDEANKQHLKDWVENVYKGYQFKNPILEEVGEDGLVSEGMSISQRSDLVHYSYEFMGIPYKWGGADEEGFDCSGFTSHVFKFSELSLPRVASEQYKYAKTINAKRAFMGDLVFFSEGKEITHVGILVNQPNERKRMIHSSSSKGISVVDIDDSDYWRSRLVGYGRIIK